MAELTTPRVFISYSHDSSSHQLNVLEFANRLRADGIDAVIDRYEQFPAEGWPRWMAKQVEQADFVLIVCTDLYNRRYRGEEEPDRGKGVAWESVLIRNYLYDQKGSRTFIPVLFPHSKVDDIPTALRGFSYFQIPDRYDDLYRLLTHQPEVQKPQLGRNVSTLLRQQRVGISVVGLASRAVLFGCGGQPPHPRDFLRHALGCPRVVVG